MIAGFSTSARSHLRESAETGPIRLGKLSPRVLFARTHLLGHWAMYASHAKTTFSICFRLIGLRSNQFNASAAQSARYAAARRSSSVR